VPYFSKFIVTEVSGNLTKLTYLKTLMQLTGASHLYGSLSCADAFFTHPTFRLEPYLNQLMPCVLTCLVGMRLCADHTEDHWGLRDYVAQRILPKACKYARKSDNASLLTTRIGKEYFIFQARVIKTLANTFLDITRTIPAHYGDVQSYFRYFNS
jgi:transcription initiation factor TFIID subunit 6